MRNCHGTPHVPHSHGRGWKTRRFCTACPHAQSLADPRPQCIDPVTKRDIAAKRGRSLDRQVDRLVEHDAPRPAAHDDRAIGQDVSVAWIWRPYFSQNIVMRLSGAALRPGDGLADLYGDDDTYYTVLGNLVLTF